MDALWFWIPIIVILALLLGAFSDWLGYKTRVGERDPAPDAPDLDALRAEFAEREAALRARIETLEAIVTSQTWDLLADDAPAGERDRAALRAHLADDAPAPADDAERLARLARRLRL